MESKSQNTIKLDSPIDPFYLSPLTFLMPFGIYHTPEWEKASIQSAMSSYSVNLSNESPKSGPSTSLPPSPAGASISDATPLSPRSVLAALDAHPDVSAQQLWQLVHSLALTIQTRASQHASQVAGLKNVIADLEENLGQVAERWDSPPEGYVRNNDDLIPGFDIQQDGNLVRARFVHLHTGDPTCVHGLMGNEKPGEGPYSKPVYATPVCGLVPVALPSWFHHMLIGRTAHFKKLRNAALTTNNFGIIADISRYRQDHDVLRQLIQEQEMLSAKLELIRERLGLTRGRLEATNAPNLIRQLEWEEDRRAEPVPYTPKQRQGRFATAPPFPVA